jgi:hypothetical protein
MILFIIGVLSRSNKRSKYYGLESKDNFTFSGNAKNKFKVRIIGGEETITIYNDRTASGKKIHIYDVQDSIDVSGKKYRINRNEDTLYEYKRDRTKYDWFHAIYHSGLQS